MKIVVLRWKTSIFLRKSTNFKGKIQFHISFYIFSVLLHMVSALICILKLCNPKFRTCNQVQECVSIRVQYLSSIHFIVLTHISDTHLIPILLRANSCYSNPIAVRHDILSTQHHTINDLAVFFSSTISKKDDLKYVSSEFSIILLLDDINLHTECFRCMKLVWWNFIEFTWKWNRCS